MKIEAYKCDKCGGIADYNGTYGISQAPDLFTQEYKLTKHRPDKTTIHVCGECVRQFVTLPAQPFHRRPDQYHEKIKEFSKILVNSVLHEVRTRKHG